MVTASLANIQPTERKVTSIRALRSAAPPTTCSPASLGRPPNTAKPRPFRGTTSEPDLGHPHPGGQ
jgi:hypothetical protein